ncbi:MAG: hypothetical protein ACRD8W_15660 [Nitrososphaeraceae archaeon]
MQKAQETIKQNNESQSVTIEGLQFKKYQMDLIKFLARIYNIGDVNEFITETVLTSCLAKIRGMNFPEERNQLERDGYKDIREKVMVLSGPPAEVLLDNVVSDDSAKVYAFRDESVSGLSVAGIWTRTVKKVEKEN